MRRSGEWFSVERSYRETTGDAGRKLIRHRAALERTSTIAMIVKQLAHLCFYTNQLPTMIAFYRDTLGLPVRFTMKTDDGIEFGYYFAMGQTTFVEIFDQAGAVKQWGGDAAPRLPNTNVRYGHFCLEIVGLEDAVAELRRKGIQVRPISVGMDHSKQAWIKDPDGNDIELMEYTPKSLQLTSVTGPR